MKKNTVFPKGKVTHLTNEERVFVAGVETGKLYIDRQGKVWRIFKDERRRAERIRSNPRCPSGIQNVVVIAVKGKFITCTTTRLVWLALKGRIPHLKVVTTKDGNVRNTNPSNLILCSQDESIEIGKKRSFLQRAH